LEQLKTCAKSAFVEVLSICVKVAGCCRLARETAKKVFWKCEDTANHNNGKLKLCTHAAISAQSYLRGAQVISGKKQKQSWRVG